MYVGVHVHRINCYINIVYVHAYTLVVELAMLEDISWAISLCYLMECYTMHWNLSTDVSVCTLPSTAAIFSV